MVTILTAQPSRRYCVNCQNLIYGGYCECDDGLCDEPTCVKPAIFRLEVVDMKQIGLHHVMTCEDHVGWYYALMPVKFWEYVGV